MNPKTMITAVDTHCEGEPCRVITGGVVRVPGATMLEKRNWLEKEGDWLRSMMLKEPRGYPALCCNLVLPATDPSAQAGFIIMEHTEYPAMSGANTISVATVLLETGMLPMTEPVTEFNLEAPAGLVGIKAECKDGKVTGVTFKNVPSYTAHLDKTITVPTIGEVVVDVAWGGMYYVIAEAKQLGLKLIPENGREIVRISEMIHTAAAEQLEVIHPENPAFNGVTICQLTDRSTRPGVHRINAVTVPTGKLDWDNPLTWTGVLDRSPCGTGTCAAMARLYARGDLKLNEDFLHQGVMGTVFKGRLIEETRLGATPAVVPTVRGQAWITAITQYVMDSTDPFPEGFTVGDLW